MVDLRAHSDGYKLAFDEGGRALDAQERSVNALRSRAGVLLAAAAITTSFFGARVFADDALTVAGWIAVAAFVLVAAAVLIILWPWRDWEFSADPVDVIATYIETESSATTGLPAEAGPPATLAEIHRDLALHRSASYTDNARLLGKLFWAFRVCLVLVAVEVSAWIVALSTHG